MRTQSTIAGGGANELSFEDQRGKEQIRIIAQHNLREEVRNDRSTEIGHDDALAIEGSSHVSVKGDQFVDVRGTLFEDVAGTKRTRFGGLNDTITATSTASWKETAT